MTLTKEELDAIEARCEAATAGEWKLIWGGSEEYPYPLSIHTVSDAEWVARDGTVSTRENADFIVQAKTDIPALLAEVMLQRTVLDLIEDLDGQTLLGPDSRHRDGDGANCYHEQGAAAAFSQAADLARTLK